MLNPVSFLSIMCKDSWLKLILVNYTCLHQKLFNVSSDTPLSKNANLQKSYQWGIHFPIRTLYLKHFFPSAICSLLLTSETLSFPDRRIDLLLVWNCWCEMWSANPLIHISRHLCSHTNILFYRILNVYLVYPLHSSLKGPRQNFSVQYRYNIKQTNDENIENYQLGDY